jgi:hypothetical protein
MQSPSRRHPKEISMDDADRPVNSSARQALRTGVFYILIPVSLVATIAAFCGGVAIAKSTVKPRPGSYSGDVGAFTLSFKVSPNGEKLTGLRTDFQGTVNCGPPDDEPVFFDFPTLAIASGHFDGDTIMNNSDINPRYTLKGEFNTPTHAEGTINVFFTYPHNALPPCNETDKFSAMRRD